ncbi:MAG: class I SAM-dependent methyltransferase [Candidatus Hodarchaeota archaeon]
MKIISRFQLLLEWAAKKSNISTRYMYNNLSYFADVIGPKKLVIDIGAGSSPYKKLFIFNYYVSLDIKGIGNIDIIGDAIHLPIKSGVADLILCVEVLEHLKNPDSGISEINRIMKDGGYSILTTPFIKEVHETVDFYRLTEMCLQWLFKKNELSIKLLKKRGAIFSTICQILNEIPYQSLGGFQRKSTYTIKEFIRYAFAFLWYILLIPFAYIVPKFDHKDRLHNWTLGYDCLIVKKER